MVRTRDARIGSFSISYTCFKFKHSILHIISPSNHGAKQCMQIHSPHNNGPGDGMGTVVAHQGMNGQSEVTQEHK